MDAYGNLTTQAEFSGGRRIRFISYLSQDCAIGATGSITTAMMGVPMLVAPQVGLHHLSAGDAQQTEFVADACPGGFTLAKATDPRLQLSWGAPRESLILTDAQINALAASPTFVVEFVDGVWFNLRNADGSLVVDCAGGDTNEGQPLLGWEGNGGDNQKWRAEVVAPVLGAATRPPRPQPRRRLRRRRHPRRVRRSTRSRPSSGVSSAAEPGRCSDPVAVQASAPGKRGLPC